MTGSILAAVDAATEGHGVGIWIDPATGQLLMSESVHTAMGIVVWLVVVVLGLVTSWLVLP